MTPDEMLTHCRAQLALDPNGAQVGLVLPGSFGSGQKRLCAGGPLGKVVKENHDGTVLVFFKAQAIINFIEAAV